MTDDGTREYSYDSQDRLVQIVDEKGRATKYTYDSLGRRTAADFNGEVTKYYHLGDSGKVIKEVRPGGTEIGFTYDNEGSPLTMSYNGQTYFYVFNGHGDVVALTDANGVKVADYRYDPWGNALKPHDEDEKEDIGETAGLPGDSGDIGELNPYRYAWYRYDAKTKLYFLKTRYYNPQLGRFLSKDKYIPEDTDEADLHPIAQNKYVYVNDNPVNLVDPNGQKGFSLKGFVSSVRSAPARVASTVKSIARAVSPRATVSRIISSGSKIAANIKAGASKITAKVQRGINKSIKTVKNLANPKTMRQKTRAAVSGVKATMSSIKKMVSGKISKAEKFAGAQKLALLSAAKTAKGKTVKYALPIVSKITNVGNQAAKGVGDFAKQQKGAVLSLYDSTKNSLKKAKGKAAAFGVSLSGATTFNIGRTKSAGPQQVTKRISSSHGIGKTKTWDQQAAVAIEQKVDKYIIPPLNKLASNFTSDSVENFLSKSPLYNLNEAISGKSIIKGNLSPTERQAKADQFSSLMNIGIVSLGVGGIKAGPNFVVAPSGEAIIVPKGAMGPGTVNTGKGFNFLGGSGGNGLNNRVTGVRIMDPTGRYPDGYAVYMNQNGQTVNPWTGRTVGKSDPFAHLPLNQGGD